ncbi:hypothetical protein [Rhizobium sp. LjRoot254]|uniref:hypothetical protein n=1 Tax=Rhizobium sp. LjRoot254 TaxID=3342297 RepID=UPI003ECF895A
MSSETRVLSGTMPAPLIRSEYREHYRGVLLRHLPPNLSAFSAFFANTKRLETMAGMLQRHFHGTGNAVLNIGCGPFASEIFVAALQHQAVHALDYTPEFAVFFDIFRDEGVLEGVSFANTDVMMADFPLARFNLIVMHDLLYETALELDTLLARLLPLLAADGLLYIDFMNAHLHWLWMLLGKEKQYRRYRPRDVWGLLDRHGLAVLEHRPVLPSAGGLTALFHRLLRAFGTSNAIAVVARLKSGHG